MEIKEPSKTREAYDNVLDNMYLGAVSNRLRQLDTPYESDFKRWIWELIQNAKDTIAKNPNRNEIKVRIEIEGDIVRFRHDGDPFTAVARLALLYKYSDGKTRGESTGRFGTGFLTTHCLSKIVDIESNMFGDDDKLCGFSVTMYREGEGEELRNGLKKMRESAKYYDTLYDWTTYTYHISTENGYKAIRLGVENFHENIAQTMLFCKELASVELINNGVTTRIIRMPQVDKGNGIIEASFKVEGERNYTRKFLYLPYLEHSEELSKRYNKNRSIRLDVAIEVDEANNIVSHTGMTSYFCVLPLVGIESQLDEPLIVNSPDFEPEAERQSILLSGSKIRENSDNIISDTGINQLIYERIFPLYKILLNYAVNNKLGNLYLFANGLKTAKKHKDLDSDWYFSNVISKYREILLNTNLFEDENGQINRKISDCIFVKEKDNTEEQIVYKLLESLYPSKLVKDNHNWAHILWKDDINLWDLKSLCLDITEKKNWYLINLTKNTVLKDWFNEFLSQVLKVNELLLKEYALLPNMNGDFMKRNAENFKQGENITTFIIDLLLKLGKDVKPTLLHDDIKTVTLDSKYNPQSYSADINKLIKSFIDNVSSQNKLHNVLPLLSVLPTDTEKYKPEFISQRKDFFYIAKSLFSLTDAISTENNNLLTGAWSELDTWFVTYVLQTLKNLGDLSKLPEGLGAQWLNDSLKSLKVEISKLNTYEVLPNQKGKFCAQNKLYEDNGIPESLKVETFDGISLILKDILLHKDIEASSFAINQKKSIASFASELKDKYASQSSSNSSSPYLMYGRYYKYPKATLDKVALYLLSLLPSDKETEVGKNQDSLYTTSFNILGSETVPCSGTINYSSKDLWQDANLFVARMIVSKIKTAAKIETLNEQLGFKGDIYIYEQLNSFYDFLQKSGISYNEAIIFPNQEGEFCSICNLKKEEGQIDDTIKNIICLLVKEEEDYRHLLMDSRSRLQPQASLNSDNAYSLIDEKVAEFYKNPEKWKDEKFIKASQLLIEDWGDLHKGTFEEKFPRVFDDKEKILMNVVWKKEKRELMMSVSTQLSEDQLRIIIENSTEIGNLSAKVKVLEDENEILRSQLAAIGLLPESNQIDEDADDFNVDKRSDIIVPVEIDTVTEDGEHRTIIVAEPQYAGLSTEEMHDYLIQAKTDVMLFLKEKGYRFERGICEDAWCNIYGVYNPEGKEVPMVVHSYKSRRRAFSLNASDWEQLSKEGSMLWVVTHDGPQCVPFYALPRDTNTIAITFSPENMQYKSRCIALAETLRYFKGLHFNFGTAISQNKSPEPFNNPKKELEQSLKNTMLDMYDLPAQNAPASLKTDSQESLL